MEKMPFFTHCKVQLLYLVRVTESATFFILSGTFVLILENVRANDRILF